MDDYKNYHVDVDGRTYRVAIHRSGKPLIVIRRDHSGDTGPALKVDGAIGRRAVKAAQAQREGMS